MSFDRPAPGTDIEDQPWSVYHMKDNQGDWNIYVRTGRIALGWGNTHADLSDADSKEEIVETCGVSDDARSRSRFRYLERFVNEISIGDIILAVNGTDSILGMGIVVSEYQFEKEPQIGDHNDQHVRRVDWQIDFKNEHDGPIEINEGTEFGAGTGPFDSKDYSTYVDQIVSSAETDHFRSAIQTVESCASLYSIGPHPEDEPYCNIYGTKTTSNYFENLKNVVASPLTESVIEDIRDVFAEYDTDPPGDGVLESSSLTVWGIPSNYNKKYNIIECGDWIIHTRKRNHKKHIVAIQKVDHSLAKFDNKLRKEISDILYGVKKFHNLWLSTTPVILVDTDFKFLLKNLSNDKSSIPEYFSRYTYFTPFPEEEYRHYSSSTEFIADVLKSGSPLEYELSAWPINELPESNDANEYFIFITSDSDKYHDRHLRFPFSEEIEGSRKVLEAGSNAVVVHLNNEFYQGAGRLSTVDKDEPEDDESAYVAEFDDYTELTQIPRDDVENSLTVNTDSGREIISITHDDYREIITKEPETGGHSPEVSDVASKVAKLDQDSRYDHPLYKESLAHLVAGRNLVFFGPPGTGKTRAARNLSEVVCEIDREDIQLETANAEWTNYEVSGGYAPKLDHNGGARGPTESQDDGSVNSDTDGLSWRSKPGVLAAAAEACHTALSDSGRPSWAIIDELNRANLDQAFGEVFTLLDIDYRDSEPITYGDEEVFLPFSFRILATMNSQDQAQLFSLGYAFRRRFGFVEVPSLLGNFETPSDLPSAKISKARNALADVDSDLLSLIINAATEGLDATNDRVDYTDPAAIFPDVADSGTVAVTVDELKNTDVTPAGLEASPFEVLTALATAITNEGIVEIGHALVIDAARFIIAYHILYKNSFDLATVDRTVTSYFIPQVEDFLSTIRREQTLGGDGGEATDKYETLLALTRGFGLEGTATALHTAKEDGQFIG